MVYKSVSVTHVLHATVHRITTKGRTPIIQFDQLELPSLPTGCTDCCASYKKYVMQTHPRVCQRTAYVCGFTPKFSWVFFYVICWTWKTSWHRKCSFFMFCEDMQVAQLNAAGRHLASLYNYHLVDVEQMTNSFYIGYLYLKDTHHPATFVNFNVLNIYLNLISQVLAF